MTTVLYVVLCLSAVVFAAATAARAVQYARAPIHLRWEIYPVPHEPPDRAAHGGSYFEQSEWWAKPVQRNRWGTLKALAIEVLFLNALRELNRPLWRRSYPFHLGLYLLVASAALVLAAALGTLAAPSVISGWPGSAMRALYRLTGIAGLLCAPVGAAALLHRRLTDPDLRAATVPGDIFNAAAFVVAIGTLGLGLALRPADAPGPLALLVGLLRWDSSLRIAPLFAAGLALSALLVAYVPFTHMSHFVGKYFTYHAVRWDDAVSRRGSGLEKAMAAYLAYRPTWAARHVAADGSRTWADIAASAPPDKTTR